MAANNRERKYIVGVSGNIGVGKSTLTKILGDRFKWKAHNQPTSDNPYLVDFYKDMKRWAFNLQVYSLSHRLMTLNSMNAAEYSSIHNRTIYEEFDVFTNTLYEIECLSERDFNSLRALYDSIIPTVDYPQLVIYLRASTDTLLSRIARRGRKFESPLTPEYLHALNINYEKWIDNYRANHKVLVVETDSLNILEDRAALDKIIQRVRLYCPE